MFARFLRYGFYPASLAGSLAVAVYGITHGASLLLVLSCITLFFMATCITLELVYTENPSWRFDAQELRTDILHAVFSNTIPTEIFRFLFYGVILAAAAHLEGVLGVTFWPHHWPLLAELAFALLVVEFMSYWIHRSLHTIPALWPLHAIHHCSRHYYCMIGPRKHPLQAAYTFGIRLTALWFLGAPQEILTLYTILSSTNSLIQHTNIDMRCGVLNWIFATPELHRWHHSKDIGESNRNYGDILIIWDALFGTRILPRDRQALVAHGLGLPEGTRVDNSYWGHLKMPFVWRRIQPTSPGE